MGVVSPVEAEEGEPIAPVAVALALGSNLGDRMAYLAAGVAALRDVVEITAVSSVFETEPVGNVDQPVFLNAAVAGRTRLPPRALLEAARRAEAAAGRARPFPGAPRTLDVDVILYGSRVVQEADLVVPHPRWRERGFVLAPLAEVASDLVDPETGLTVADVAEGAREKAGRPRRIAPPSVIDGSAAAS